MFAVVVMNMFIKVHVAVRDTLSEIKKFVAEMMFLIKKRVIYVVTASSI